MAWARTKLLARRTSTWNRAFGAGGVAPIRAGSTQTSSATRLTCNSLVSTSVGARTTSRLPVMSSWLWAVTSTRSPAASMNSIADASTTTMPWP